MTIDAELYQQIAAANNFPSKSTISLYVKTLQRMETEVGSITVESIMRSNSTKSNSVKSARIHALRSYIKTMSSVGKCSTIDKKILKIPNPKVIHKDQHSPDVETMQRIVGLFDTDTFEHSRNRLYILFNYGCGLRISELTKMEHDDIDVATSMLTIRESKGGKTRHVPIPKTTLDAYIKHREQYPTGSPRVITLKNGKSIYPQYVDVVMLRRVRRIDPDISTHAIRRAYATHLHAAGAKLLYISRLLGHASIQTTIEHYIKYDEKELKDAAALHPLK
jgi:integrase/recombinase XerD